MTDVLAGFVLYVPVVIAAVFLNAADIYFLQSDQSPRLDRSPSFWLYLFGHVVIALLAAYILYEKSGFSKADWPIGTAIASLVGFSVIQSLTLKFGDKGVDARDLFDAWKRRVLEDVSKSNASQKRLRIANVSRKLAEKAQNNPNLLQSAIHQLAASVQVDPAKVIADIKASGQDQHLMMAQWIATVDLDFAESLTG